MSRYHHHHQHRARAVGFLPSAHAMRLVSMLVMLGVIGLTIERNAPWRRQGAPGQPPVAPAEAIPLATAPHATLLSTVAEETDTTVDGEPAADRFDRDPEEMAAFRREIETVADGETLILPVEMPAYWRLLQWVVGQSTAELAARQPQRVTFQELRQYPDKYRGQLIELDLNIRQAFRNDAMVENNPAGVSQLFELWGFPTVGRGWLYDVITPELPAGFPEGAGIKQRVRVYGYFFKLQGYVPLGAKPNARPQIAPLIVGRVEAVQTPVLANPAEEMLTVIVLAGGGVIVLGAIGYWIVAARRKNAARANANSDWPAAGNYAAQDDFGESNFPAPDKTDPDAPGAFDWLREDT